MGDALSHARDREEERLEGLQKKIISEHNDNVKLSTIITVAVKINEAGQKIKEFTETRDDLIEQLRKLVGGQS